MIGRENILRFLIECAGSQQPCWRRKQWYSFPLGKKFYFMQIAFIVLLLQHGRHEHTLYLAADSKRYMQLPCYKLDQSVPTFLYINDKIFGKTQLMSVSLLLLSKLA